MLLFLFGIHLMQRHEIGWPSAGHHLVQIDFLFFRFGCLNFWSLDSFCDFLHAGPWGE